MKAYPFSGEVPNIKLRGQHRDPDEKDKDFILHNYHYMTLQELSDHIGCAKSTVFNVLKSKGIHRHKKSDVLITLKTNNYGI